MATIRDEAVCVRIWDWSETSQTVSLLTREHGLLRGLAKGAKRDQGAFSGGFELATAGEIVAIIKRDGQLATLTAWDLREPHAALRRELAGFYAGCALVEVAHESVNDQDPHPGLYDALARALTRSAVDPADAVTGFLWSALVETGYRPELDTRGGSLGSGNAEPMIVGFKADSGGLTADPGPGAGDQVWRVRADTIGALQQIVSGQRDIGIEVDGAVRRRVLKLLSAYTRQVLGRDLPALTLLVERLARFG